jgi:hypothetical protein
MSAVRPPRCSPCRRDPVVSQQREGTDVSRSDHAEVSPVDRRDLGQSEAFGHGHNRSVDSSQREVAVADDEFGGPAPVFALEVDDRHVTVSQRCEKSGLGRGACFTGQQVAGFGDDRRRYRQHVAAQVCCGERGDLSKKWSAARTTRIFRMIQTMATKAWGPR